MNGIAMRQHKIPAEYGVVRLSESFSHLQTLHADPQHIMLSGEVSRRSMICPRCAGSPLTHINQVADPRILDAEAMSDRETLQCNAIQDSPWSP
jgi:hypothetical protein